MSINRTLEKAAIHAVVKLYVMAVVIAKIVKESKWKNDYELYKSILEFEKKYRP